MEEPHLNNADSYRKKSHRKNETQRKRSSSVRRKSSKRVTGKFLRGAKSRLNKLGRTFKEATGNKLSYEKPFEEMDESALRRALKDSISDHKKIALPIFSKAIKLGLIQKENFIRDSRLQKLVKIALDARDLDILTKILTECQTRKIFVDYFIRTNLLFGDTIPYCIAGFAEMPIVDKKRWIETLMSLFPYKFDLNRDVGFGGNILFNSFSELHIHNMEWYSFLIEKNVHVNSKHNRKTILDKIIDMKDEKLNELQSFLESKGGKTFDELKK